MPFCMDSEPFRALPRSRGGVISNFWRHAHALVILKRLQSPADPELGHPASFVAITPARGSQVLRPGEGSTALFAPLAVQSAS
jgi:hypothetical protein